MPTAKLFRNGQSQAVRLPKDFALPGQEVYVRRVGQSVLLVPKDDPWSLLEAARELFTDDFMQARVQEPPQERDGL